MERHGRPEAPEDVVNHRFVGFDDPSSRAPFAQWLRENVPAGQIIFRSGDNRAVQQAVISGVGLGFMRRDEAAQHPELVEVHPPIPEWESRLWLVTHMDLHRTTKVQTFVQFLKDWFKEDRAA